MYHELEITEQFGKKLTEKNVVQFKIKKLKINWKKLEL